MRISALQSHLSQIICWQVCHSLACSDQQQRDVCCPNELLLRKLLACCAQGSHICGMLVQQTRVVLHPCRVILSVLFAFGSAHTDSGAFAAYLTFPF